MPSVELAPLPSVTLAASTFVALAQGSCLVAGARGLVISADMEAQPPTALSCFNSHQSRKHPTPDCWKVTGMIASVDVHPTCACNYTPEEAYESRWGGPVAEITLLNKALLSSWSSLALMSTEDVCDITSGPSPSSNVIALSRLSVR